MNRYPNSVPRDFGDLLEALANHIRQSGNSLPGVDQATLDAAVQAQRESEQHDRELAAGASGYHRQFAEETAVRYALFWKAVQTLRALYRDRPEVLATLAQFKRRMTRHKAATTPQPTT